MGGKQDKPSAPVQDGGVSTEFPADIKPVANAMNQWAQYGYQNAAYAAAAKAAAADANDIARIAALNATVEKVEGKAFLKDVDSAAGNIVANALGYGLRDTKPPWQKTV